MCARLRAGAARLLLGGGPGTSFNDGFLRPRLPASPETTAGAQCAVSRVLGRLRLDVSARVAETLWTTRLQGENSTARPSQRRQHAAAAAVGYFS